MVWRSDSIACTRSSRCVRRNDSRCLQLLCSSMASTLTGPIFSIESVRLVDFRLQRRARLVVGRRLDLGQRVDAGVQVERDLLAQQVERRARRGRARRSDSNSVSFAVFHCSRELTARASSSCTRVSSSATSASSCDAQLRELVQLRQRLFELAARVLGGDLGLLLLARERLDLLLQLRGARAEGDDDAREVLVLALRWR